jgi:hypothetical protein
MKQSLLSIMAFVIITMALAPLALGQGDELMIRLGAKNPGALYWEVIKSGYIVSPMALDMLEDTAFTVCSGKKVIKVVVVQVGDLGLGFGGTLSQIYERGLALGLRLCPAEVGPQLCLQYKKMPKRMKEVGIAMERFVVDGYDVVFSVGYDKEGHKRLGVKAVSNEPFSEPTDYWAFIRPRKVK